MCLACHVLDVEWSAAAHKKPIEHFSTQIDYLRFFYKKELWVQHKFNYCELSLIKQFLTHFYYFAGAFDRSIFPPHTTETRLPALFFLSVSILNLNVIDLIWDFNFNIFFLFRAPSNDLCEDFTSSDSELFSISFYSGCTHNTPRSVRSGMK